MNKGLEALEYLRYCQIVNGINDDGNYNLSYLYKVMKETFNTIEYELNALEIIKNKKVNLFHIWVFDEYEQYKQHYPFSEYSATEDMLTFEEFDLLKEWLEDE